MKKISFIVAALAMLFTVSAVSGCNDSRGGNKTRSAEDADDTRDGIDITFVPAGAYDAAKEELDAAAEVIKTRLVTLGINDNEVSRDYKRDRIIVHFPWQADESESDAQAVAKELGETAQLTFRKGTDTVTDEEGNVYPTGGIVLTGGDIDSANYLYRIDEIGGYAWVVTLKLKESGREAFTAATSELAHTGTPISIWIDNTLISAPIVNNTITGDSMGITGNFDSESSKKLADQINSGSLPFKMEISDCP